FAEGGTACYFVRIGTGAAAWLGLEDRSGKGRTSLVIRALEEGKAGNDITVKVEEAHVGVTTSVLAKAELSGAKDNQRTATTAKDTDADNFRPGDIVILEKSANSARTSISSIAKDATAHTTTFTLVDVLTFDYSGGTMRVADLAPGQTRI